VLVKRRIKKNNVRLYKKPYAEEHKIPDYLLKFLFDGCRISPIIRIQIAKKEMEIIQ